MKKLSVILFLLSVMTGTLFANTPAKKFDKGSGYFHDPFVIENLAHLRWLSEHKELWNACFKQVADIDASETESWNGGKGFSPIGDNQTQFKGFYHGMDHKIVGLTIDKNTNGAGLFGICEGLIFSLILEKPKVKGTAWVGAVAGNLLGDGRLHNCHVINPDVKGTKNSVGGLVGKAKGGKVSLERCFVTGEGSISGQTYVGALVGEADKVKVDYCFSDDVIVSADQKFVGGLVGCSLNAQYTDCYAGSAVNIADATGEAGGFGGALYNSTLKCCCVTGGVQRNGSADKTVSFNGKVDQATIFEDCYYDNVNGYTNTPTETGKCEGMNLIQAKLEDLKLNKLHWSKEDGQYPILNTTWSLIIAEPSSHGKLTIKHNGVEIPPEGKLVKINDKVTISAKPNKGYIATFADIAIDFFSGINKRFLNCNDQLTAANNALEGEITISEGGYRIGIKVTFDPLPIFAGSGTKEDPFQIAKLEELDFLSSFPYLWSKHFIQVADIDASLAVLFRGGNGFQPIGYKYMPFTGTYDGQGHVIKNLTIENQFREDLGFFGYLEGKVDNLHLLDPEVVGSSAVGALVGMMDNANATISRCTVTNPKINVIYGCGGGLVGYNKQGKVIMSAVTGEGSVKGADFIGGLAGIASSLEQCFAEGMTLYIYGQNGNVGGLVGSAITGRFDNCFSNCKIIFSKTTVESIGGLVGTLYDKFSNSYAVGSILTIDGETIKNKGFLGGKGVDADLTNCYYQTDGGITSKDFPEAAGKLEGLTKEQLQSGNLPKGFDENIWSCKKGEYPRLKNVETLVEQLLDGLRSPVQSLLLAEIIPAPNPFGQQLRVLNAEPVLRYALRNTLGQIVLSGKHAGQSILQLQTQHLPTGLYLLELQAEDGLRALKVIKQ